MVSNCKLLDVAATQRDLLLLDRLGLIEYVLRNDDGTAIPVYTVQNQ